MTRTILIVDDETNMRWVLSRALEQAGYTAHSAATGDEAFTLVSREPVDLVLLDLKLRGEDGLTVLRRLRERRPDLVVMMLTAHGTVPNAVEAMQLGAADFLRKPFDVEEVLFKIGRALERRAMQKEIARLTGQQRQHNAFDTLIGTEPRWQQAVAQAQYLAATAHDVVLLGETGSGRATLARAMHAASPRHDLPLVTFDGRAFRDARSMLFGTQAAAGVWAQAGRGTLLVRDLPPDDTLLDNLYAQMCSTPLRPRVLLVASDAVPLPDALLAQMPAQVTVPALRTRRGDIAVFAQHVVSDHPLTSHALVLLERYTWPGNVGELRGVLHRAHQLAGDAPIDAVHLPRSIAADESDGGDGTIRLPPHGVNLEDVEQSLIRQALERAQGNKSKAAELLGLTRHTLLYRMEKYGISAPERSA